MQGMLARRLRAIPSVFSRLYSESAAGSAGGVKETSHREKLGPVLTRRQLRDRFCTDPYEKPGEPRPQYPKRRSPFKRAKALIDALHEEEALTMMKEGRAVLPTKIPNPSAGDVITITYAPNKNMPSFTQRFTGICIAVRRRGIGSSFILRNVIDGVPVERGFPIYCPTIRDAEVVRKRRVRRRKLYYLREKPNRESTFELPKRAKGSNTSQ